MHEARTQALKRNAQAWLLLDTATNTMQVQGTGAGGTVNLGAPEFLAQSVTYQGFAGVRQVVFDSLGRPTTPPEVVSIGSGGGMSASVTVSSTGRITVQ